MKLTLALKRTDDIIHLVRNFPYDFAPERYNITTGFLRVEVYKFKYLQGRVAYYEFIGDSFSGVTL